MIIILTAISFFCVEYIKVFFFCAVFQLMHDILFFFLIKNKYIFPGKTHFLKPRMAADHCEFLTM